MPPAFTTLIDAAELAAFAPEDVRIFDCRFDLQDPAAGEARFNAGHIPGAAYLHLERHLSAEAVPGSTGRHPLPGPDAVRNLLQAHAVRETTQVVAYDDSGGMVAARFWWMARWVGHWRTAVLDGGYPAWLREAAEEGAPKRIALGAASEPSQPTKPPHQATMPAIREVLQSGSATLLDARAAERFRGDVEPIDAVAGHIPGAINAPYQSNLDADGRFLGRAALRARFDALLASTGGKPVICYCGSGVSAAHNVLAMTHAGLDEPALYVGSWSEWVTDPANPVAIGNGWPVQHSGTVNEPS